MSDITGGCLCGAVRYRCTAEPVTAGHCHCIDCRKTSGTGHCSHFGVPATGVAMSGPLTEYRRAADSRHLITRSFCPTCGAPVSTRNSASPELVFIRASTLDDPERFKPEWIVYAGRAPSWDHMDAALPAHATMPNADDR